MPALLLANTLISQSITQRAISPPEVTRLAGQGAVYAVTVTAGYSRHRKAVKLKTEPRGGKRASIHNLDLIRSWIVGDYSNKLKKLLRRKQYPMRMKARALHPLTLILSPRCGGEED